MRALADFWRFRIQRRYWIVKPDSTDALHIYPNRDLMRHEATDCWCGPRYELQKDSDGADRWITEHSSLDGREIRERTR